MDLLTMVSSCCYDLLLNKGQHEQHASVPRQPDTLRPKTQRIQLRNVMCRFYFQQANSDHSINPIKPIS